MIPNKKKYDTMNDVKITERGWAGHFICADKCYFRRNTLIECNRDRIVVSTVGDYRSTNGPIEEIGHERYYETKAFAGIKQGYYWDADFEKEIPFDSKSDISSATGPSGLKLAVDNEANEMHDDVVAELVEKMKTEKKGNGK